MKKILFVLLFIQYSLSVQAYSGELTTDSVAVIFELYEKSQQEVTTIRLARIERQFRSRIWNEFLKISCGEYDVSKGYPMNKKKNRIDEVKEDIKDRVRGTTISSWLGTRKVIKSVTLSLHSYLKSNFTVKSEKLLKDAIKNIDEAIRLYQKAIPNDKEHYEKVYGVNEKVMNALRMEYVRKKSLIKGDKVVAAVVEEEKTNCELSSLPGRIKTYYNEVYNETGNLVKADTFLREIQDCDGCILGKTNLSLDVCLIYYYLNSLKAELNEFKDCDDLDYNWSEMKRVYNKIQKQPDILKKIKAFRFDSSEISRIGFILADSCKSEDPYAPDITEITNRGGGANEATENLQNKWAEIDPCNFSFSRRIGPFGKGVQVDLKVKDSCKLMNAKAYDLPLGAISSPYNDVYLDRVDMFIKEIERSKDDKSEYSLGDLNTDSMMIKITGYADATAGEDGVISVPYSDINLKGGGVITFKDIINFEYEVFNKAGQSLGTRTLNLKRDEIIEDNETLAAVRAFQLYNKLIEGNSIDLSKVRINIIAEVGQNVKDSKSRGVEVNLVYPKAFENILQIEKNRITGDLHIVKYVWEAKHKQHHQHKKQK